MQIEGYDGTTVLLVHAGYHYTLDLTQLTHPAHATGADALAWASPVLTSTDGGVAQQVSWPVTGGPEAQWLAVQALVAHGQAPDVATAMGQVTAAVAAAGQAPRLPPSRV